MNRWLRTRMALMARVWAKGMYYYRLGFGLGFWMTLLVAAPFVCLLYIHLHLLSTPASEIPAPAQSPTTVVTQVVIVPSQVTVTKKPGKDPRVEQVRVSAPAAPSVLPPQAIAVETTKAPASATAPSTSANSGSSVSPPPSEIETSSPPPGAPSPSVPMVTPSGQ